MSTISFNLNRGLEITDKRKEYPIYVRYRNGRACDLSRSLKIKVKPESWNDKKEEVKSLKSQSNTVEINNRLKDVRRHFETYDRLCIEKGIKPTTKDALKHYNQFVNPKKEQNHDLFSFFDYYIQSTENKSSTKKAQLTSLRFFKRFNDEVRPIDFEDMTLEFYDEFILFCKDNNLSVNYRGRHVKTLKTVLNNAVKRKVHRDTQFRYFKVETEEVFNVYLNQSELNAIFRLDLSQDELSDRVRDLFLIGAWTGLRISDFNNLNEHNILEEKGQRFISVKTGKTGKRVIVPIHTIVEKILKKYGNKVPKEVDNKTINKRLKDICRSAGIDDVVEIEMKEGGSEKVFKFDLVKSHTARRSFATNAYLSGLFDTFDIMLLTGHTTPQNFLKYIKADELQKAYKLANNPFFKAV